MLRRCFLLACLAPGAFATAQPRQRTYDLRNVAYRLWFNEAQKTFDAQVTDTISMLGEGTRSVWFDCQGLSVKSVSVNGKTVTFHQQDRKLFVDLDRPYNTGEKADVLIKYTGHPTGGLYFVQERDAWPSRSPVIYSKGEPEFNRQWLVSYDFPDDKTTTECWIAVRPGWTAVSNGVLVGVDKQDTAWTYHWRMDQPISTYLIAFAASDFEKSAVMLGDLPVEHYVARGLGEMGEASFGGTAKIVDYYGKLTGVPYTFDRFSQVAIPDFVTGGMENATMVEQTITTLHRPEDEPLADSTDLVAHELAHQWFGDTATCASWSHMWLNEGFATFMPSFWTRESQGEGEFELDRKQTVASGLNASRNDRAPVVLLDYGSDPDRTLRQASYAGGAARLFMLMDLVGEETFWKGVKEYLTRYRYKPATTEQFFEAMSFAYGQDLTWFRDQWFFREGEPVLQVKAEGRTVTLVQQQQAWVLDVPIWQFADGHWTVTRAHTDTNETEVTLDSDGPVLVDPEHRVMAQVYGAPPFPPDQVAAAWRAAPSAALRDELLGAVQSLRDPSLVAQLMDEEKVATLRERLANLFDRGDTPTWLRLVDDPDRRIASTAVQRLGNGSEAPEVTAKLRSVMEDDANPRIRCAALESLYSLTGDKSLIEQAWKSDASNECFRLFALRSWAIQDPARARKECLELVSSSTNTILRLEAIRRLGALKDEPGSKDVYAALVKVVRDENSYQGRMAAANALSSYGDPAALVYLRPLLDEGNTRFANSVRGAVNRLERLVNEQH